MCSPCDVHSQSARVCRRSEKSLSFGLCQVDMYACYQKHAHLSIHLSLPTVSRYPSGIVVWFLLSQVQLTVCQVPTSIEIPGTLGE